MSIGEFETALAQGPAPAAPEAISELFKGIPGLKQRDRFPLLHPPEQALDFALAQVNFSTRLRYTRTELLHVLRSPSAVMLGDDVNLKHLLSAFFDEIDETLLIRIAEGTEITWANLWDVAQVCLRPRDLKLAWIAGRAIMSGGKPAPAHASSTANR